MSEYVVDASAILEVVLEQPLAGRIEGLLSGSFVSAVNVAEVASKLVDHGTTVDAARAVLARLDLVVIPFGSEDAWPTGLLRRRTRHEHLSLGDRACLALAISMRLPAVTTDRAWGRLGLGKAVLVVG